MAQSLIIKFGKGSLEVSLPFSEFSPKSRVNFLQLYFQQALRILGIRELPFLKFVNMDGGCPPERFCGTAHGLT